MIFNHCNLLGIPVQDGAGRKGCEMGPASLRTAGLAEAIVEQGKTVSVLKNVSPDPVAARAHGNSTLKNLPEISGWTSAIQREAALAGANAIPVFMGGDHSLSAGTIPPMAARAMAAGKPFFILWLDAHPDFHTLDTTDSGNLHGVPLAYACGLPGFSPWFPEVDVAVDPKNICMMGIRSVDAAEQSHLKKAGATVNDMRRIDEFGIRFDAKVS